MQFSNNFNLPSSLVDAIAGKTYDRSKRDPYRIGVTTLINPPIQSILIARHWSELTEDISEHLFRINGSAYHYVLAQMKSENRLIEEKFTEKLNGVTIVGKIDLYEKIIKSIEDWKITCLPLNSEILTRNGFKTYDKVKMGEEVLSYDAKKDETVWTPLLKISTFKKTKLLHLKSKSFNIKCTPNHKWFIEQTSSWKNKKYVKKKLIETKDFKCNQKIICAAHCNENQNILNITETESALLGWIIGDGCITSEKYLYTDIYQSKHSNLEGIRSEFKDWIRIERIKTKGYKKSQPLHIFCLKNDKIRKLYKKIGLKKKEDILKIVTRLTSPCRKAMIKTLMLAEGSKKYFAQKNEKIYEAYQILMTLEGKRLGLTFNNYKDVKYVCDLNSRYTYTTKRSNSKSIFCDNEITYEKVWCPTTKYNSFVTRYDRQITITGNSVWSAKFGKAKDYEHQINCYAWLLGKKGIPVEKGFINQILRDWRKNEGKRYDDYPQIPFARKEIKIWLPEEQQKYVESRVEIYKTELALPDAELTVCTSEERWAKPTIYAIMKNKNKKASRVLETAALAEEWKANQNQKDTWSIVERKGGCLKCEEYCSVAPFCRFYKENYQNSLTKYA